LGSGQEFLAGKRLAWSVIPSTGDGRDAGTSATSPLLFGRPDLTPSLG